MIKTKCSVLLAAVLAAALLNPVPGNAAADANEDGQVSSAASEVVSWMFERGVEEYKAGNYKEAVVMFDGILAIDKYNGDAIAYKKRAAGRIAKKEAVKVRATREQSMADVKSEWNREPRVFGAIALPGDSEKVDPYQLAVEAMEAKMRVINIPSLDFSNSNVEDVLLFLSAASRRLKGQGEDIDIALLGMEHATGESTVSISFAEMNLYDALKLVVEMTSLKLEVRPGVVAIMPANYIPASQIITKSYDVSADVGMDFESIADSGGGADDLFGDSFAAEAVTGPINVAGFFAVVDFPMGSSAVYQPRFNKLFVKNTQANLDAVEEVLVDLEEEAAKLRSQQVEIEAKFVEFNEGALEELGFDWTVYGSGAIAGMEMKDGTYFQGSSGYEGRVSVADDAGGLGDFIYTSPVTGQQLITEPEDRQGQNFFGAAQRSSPGVFDPVATGILATMGGNPAAKVTTKSGNEALIRIAETHRYPQDYEVVTGQRTAPVVQPQDWEDFDMGVSLKVTPVVDTESGTIDLELYPQIMQFKGYDPYIVGYNAYDAGGNNSSAPGGDGSTLFAQMPYFERRSAQTQVTIADGSTVVMGGLVDERTETFRDQVPIIGDIPFLGRLFRTEGSRNVKKNLTIFVKTTQIDARGMTRMERELARQ
jgi:general secretion pathway protein D